MQRHAAGNSGVMFLGVLGVVLSAACEEGVPTAPSPAFEPSFARPADPVALRITVQDLGHHIRSDGLGSYVDGQQAVIAEIDQAGNLQFRVVQTASPARTLTFDFSHPLGAIYTPPSDPHTGFAVLTNKTNNGNPSLADLPVSGSGCYNTVLAYFDATTGYRTYFNTAAYASATYVRITRTSADSWTMESDGTCGGTPHSAALVTQLLGNKKPQPVVLQGYYDMRFSFLLERL